ncbi:5-methylcytosine restriction system specificity protein McrC [Psychrobacter sanguinis]|uniref:5-methylcytosine restriction system specificity protein McrC n=1 Tax=Psychrobacter sanguinis TaxID=861445 RepID=UPI003899EE1D
MAVQLRQPAGRDHLFHISHDIYQPNRLENRLIKSALDYILTSAVNNGEKHLVDFIRQPDGKSLGILE